MKFNDTVLLSMRSHKVCKLTGTHSYLPWLTSTIRRKLGNVTNYINNTRFLNHQTHVVEFWIFWHWNMTSDNKWDNHMMLTLLNSSLPIQKMDLLYNKFKPIGHCATNAIVCRYCSKDMYISLSEDMAQKCSGRLSPDLNWYTISWFCYIFHAHTSVYLMLLCSQCMWLMAYLCMHMYIIIISIMVSMIELYLKGQSHFISKISSLILELH